MQSWPSCPALSFLYVGGSISLASYSGMKRGGESVGRLVGTCFSYSSLAAVAPNAKLKFRCGILQKSLGHRLSSRSANECQWVMKWHG